MPFWLKPLVFLISHLFAAVLGAWALVLVVRAGEISLAVMVGVLMLANAIFAGIRIVEIRLDR